jgi:DNA-binding NarL/FixJ family response regulator
MQPLPLEPRALSSREIDCARGVAAAKSDKEIAQDLGLTPGTIKVYLSSVYKKLAITAYAVGSPRVALANIVRERPELFIESKPPLV